MVLPVFLLKKLVSYCTVTEPKFISVHFSSQNSNFSNFSYWVELKKSELLRYHMHPKVWQFFFTRVKAKIWWFFWASATFFTIFCQNFELKENFGQVMPKFGWVKAKIVSVRPKSHHELGSKYTKNLNNPISIFPAIRFLRHFCSLS